MAEVLGEGGTGEGRVGAGVRDDDAEVSDRHHGNALLERAGLAEDDDVGADELEGRRMDLVAEAGRTVLRVVGAERGQDLCGRHLLAIDGQLDLFGMLLHR